MRSIPDQRWKDVLATVEGTKIPSDPFIKNIYNVITGKTEDESIAYAVELIQTQKHRDSIVAFLLSGATFEEIGNALWESPLVIELFSKLYMDVSVFRNKLEHLSYCEYYLDAVCPSEDERNQALIRQGLSHGPKALEIWFKRAGDDVVISKDDLSNAVLHMAYTNALTAKDTSVTSPVAKEAHRWVKTAIEAIQVRDGEDGLLEKDLDAILAIEKHLAAKSPADAGISPDEILH